MKLMVISDLHYGSESTWIWDRLLNVVDYHRLNLLLSCGDWGEEVSENMFRKLLERVEVLTIFGNHDNLEILQKLGILMRDGIVYKYEGLRIAGINGIVSMKNKARDNVPRKSPEEFLSVAKKLQERRVDILLMHEVPYLPKIFKRIDERPGSLVALKALMLIKPKLAIIGHIHEHFKYACYNDILVMSINTSWKSREYIVIENYGSLKVTVWRNYTILYKDQGYSLTPGSTLQVRHNVQEYPGYRDCHGIRGNSHTHVRTSIH